MKKLILTIGAVGCMASASYAQLIDEKNVTVTMDLQPVLQLQMTTPDQIQFTFDEIQKYYGGIIKYGATVLKVSSSVSWDLYAVGTSQTAMGGAGTTNYWDQQLAYSTAANVNAVNTLPLSALEIHQYGANNYATGFAGGNNADYSPTFAPASAVVAGQNSVYESSTPYTPPVAGEKYIQGTAGTASGQGAPGGSYLTATSTPPAFTDYYFVLDYRIIPGLPAIFPAAGDNHGVAEDLVTQTGSAQAYARPGIYTMNVKYVLLEDQ